MDVSQLDTALIYFYNDRKWYKYFEEIKASLSEVNNLTDIELQSIIQKLVKDGYIIEEVQLRRIKDGRTSETSEQKMWGYYISYDGIILIDTLPKEFKEQPYKYLLHIESKNKRRAAIADVPKRFWWIYEPLKIIIPSFLDTYGVLPIKK